MTIVTNEFVLRYNHLPQWTWLNDLLIKQLWHYIFIFSNLCFILIPFSYFFAESTGFSRSTDNFCSRILQAFLETQLTLTIILSCIFLGLSTLFPIFQPKFFDLVTFWLNFPFLYSCISFAGAILLLVCTPKGILNLVIILDEKLTRPYRVNTTTERYDRVTADIDVLLSRLQLLDRYKSKYGRDVERKFSADTLPLTLENVLANHSGKTLHSNVPFYLLFMFQTSIHCHLMIYLIWWSSTRMNVKSFTRSCPSRGYAPRFPGCSIRSQWCSSSVQQPSPVPSSFSICSANFSTCNIPEPSHLCWALPPSPRWVSPGHSFK